MRKGDYDRAQAQFKITVYCSLSLIDGTITMFSSVGHLCTFLVITEKNDGKRKMQIFRNQKYSLNLFH